MAEALVRRRYFAAMRDAVVSVWGDAGLARVGAALPDEVRKQTVDPAVIAAEWLPATAVMAWIDAVWSTVAARSTKTFAAFVDRQTELGFGRVRRFLLAHATPERVLDRAAALWRDDNTAGELVVVERDDGRAALELRAHPYVASPLSRLAITELVRSIVARTRANEVAARGTLSASGALRIQVTWTG